MKTFITFLVLAFISISSFSQNELDARLYLEKAEDEMAKENYEEALPLLDKAQTALGNWSGRISYLKIVTMDNLCDYERPDNNILPLLEKEVSLYKEYASKNPDKIDMDKYKDVKNIEDLLVYAGQVRTWMEPEVKTACEYMNNNEVGKAKPLLQSSVEKGNVAAMNYLGIVYSLEKDYTEAMKWFQKAIDEGYYGALSHIATLYLHGNGIPMDANHALKLFHQAISKAGSVAAIANIALYYEFGGGDNAEALRWYKKAAAKGYYTAMSRIGNMYKSGRETTQDYHEAMKWYKKAAAANSEYGCFCIGEMYREGLGIAKNYVEALNWYQKAGNIAFYETGIIYLQGGYGIEKNYAEGIRWCEKAVANEYAKGATYKRLGKFFEKIDTTESKKWYDKAEQKIKQD